MKYEAAVSEFEDAIQRIAADLAVLTEHVRDLGHDALAHRLSTATTALMPEGEHLVAPECQTTVAVSPRRISGTWPAPSEYSKALSTMVAMLDYVAREAERVGAYDVMAAALSGCELARQTRPQPTKQ